MPGTVESFISGATRLPALPTVITRLMLDLKAPNTSTEDISQTIESDTTLSAKVLKLANSVFYARMEKVASVHQATVRLGRKTLRSLALTVWTQSVRDAVRTDEERQLVEMQLTHGTAAAVAAGMLTQGIDRRAAEDCYIAGLLHDIGRLALLCQMGATYAHRVLQRAVEEPRDILELEREVLGFDHAMLGSKLMASWNIPPICIEAAARHHEAEIDAEANPLLAAVSAGDVFVTKMGFNVAIGAPRMARQDLIEGWTDADQALFMDDCRQRIETMIEVLSGI